MTQRMLVTGSSGLVGSAMVRHFQSRDWEVHGIDNNLRADFFGHDGDTTAELAALQTLPGFFHYAIDIRDRNAVCAAVERLRPDAVVHCAAQPAHDLAATRPFDDFDVNAGGTFNLLEAMRTTNPEAPFVHLSTNKVYGDAPNEIALVERETRYDFADPDFAGIAEDCRIDQSLHSLMGSSKLAADIAVQEFGRYFGMPTVCFRCGCLTGSAHAGAELHGFLSYLSKAINTDRTYRIFGYKGKQVRDNLHAEDVCTAAELFITSPQAGAVFNLGGGRQNSISVLEAIDRLEHLCARPLKTQYVETPRKGDHVCYISDTAKFSAAYPTWSVLHSLDDICSELAQAHQSAAQPVS